MRFHSLFTFSSLLLGGLNVLAKPLLETRANGIDQTTYNDLERYTKYSSAVYQWICPKPLGNKLIDQVRYYFFAVATAFILMCSCPKKFDQNWTQGFIVRDDSRKEIVVAFRGTLEIGDAFVGRFTRK